VLKLESAWLQRLKLKGDSQLSSYTFNSSSRPYTKAPAKKGKYNIKK
jgi:hypothetical protein